MASITASATCVPAGPSKKASGLRSAVNCSRTLSIVVGWAAMEGARYPGPSGPGPTVRAVRLRPLTEAECYARCYGARDERVSVLHDLTGSARPAAVAES